MTDGGPYDPNSPAADPETDVADSTEAIYSEDANGPLTCPLSLNSALIPGTIAPFHDTWVGAFNELLTRITMLSPSPTGVPAARYKVPYGPWISKDGLIGITQGWIDGYCWFKPTALKIATGSLHVFNSQVEFYTKDSHGDDGPVDSSGPSDQPPGGGGDDGVQSSMSGPYDETGHHVVCLVTDWYQSDNGGPWYYTDSELNSCWIE